MSPYSGPGGVAVQDRRRAASAFPARRARLAVALAALAIALAAIALESLRRGAPALTPDQLAVVLHGGGSDLAKVVVLQLRLPRLVLAILAGACLAVAGALLQDTLRNPLAGPELLGVSSGAGLVVTITLVLHLHPPPALLPPLGLAGGLAAGGFVIGLTLRQHDPVRTVLLPAADLIARLLFFPAELPVGIWLTVLGAPIFLVLFGRQLRTARR
ncbi:MAG: iron chelate uptake ABC transporter family permease subunit [Pseudonocardiaceae bacterium]